MAKLRLVVLVVVLAVLMVGTASCGIFPESSGEFEMTGEMVMAYHSGSLYAGGGEKHNTWSYQLILSEEEYERVDDAYTEWLRKSGPIDSQDREGMVYYGRESTGNWCGLLPDKGARIHVNSPTGYTRDVTIEDLDTGEIYRSQGSCKLPIYVYHYRIIVRKTGKVIQEGTTKGRDIFEASEPFSAYGTDDHYAFQIWKGDRPTLPPSFDPEP